MSRSARRALEQLVLPERQPAAGRRDPGRATSPIAAGNETPGGLVAHDDGSERSSLQHTAGNRAVARLSTDGVVQRHVAPTTNAEAEQAAGERPAEAVPDAATGEAGAEGTIEPASGTGTTGTTGGGLKGDARKKAIEDTCRASNTGTWAMGIIEKWKIPVDYEFGGTGSFHRSGSIFLNKNLGIGGAALVLMHEAQHANTFKSGKAADATKLGRDEYVKAKIADEAEAVVRQIEGMAVTKSLGVDMAGAGVTDALKERYLKAFYKKRDELRAADPGMSTGEINRICRKATRDGEVTSWFHDGTFITSTKKNSYAVYYGNQWDDLNKPPEKKP
jgi:hypothetical protein